MSRHTEKMQTPLYALLCGYLEGNGWERSYSTGYERWTHREITPSPRTLSVAVEIQCGVEGGRIGLTTAGFPATDAVEPDLTEVTVAVIRGVAS